MKTLASKENAEKALGFLKNLDCVDIDNTTKLEMEDFIKEFLQAAKRKLPTQASYEKEMQRKKAFFDKKKKEKEESKTEQRSIGHAV